MRALGFARELKTAAEGEALEPALQYSEERVLGGVYSAADESGDAYKFTAELARRAAGSGVRFLTGETIEQLDARGGAVEAVRLASGPLQADAYVVAPRRYGPPLPRK